jgi:hypothetical protein
VAASCATSACKPHRSWIEAQVALGRNAVSIYQGLVDTREFAYAPVHGNGGSNRARRTPSLPAGQRQPLGHPQRDAKGFGRTRGAQHGRGCNTAGVSHGVAWERCVPGLGDHHTGHSSRDIVRIRAHRVPGAGQGTAKDVEPGTDVADPARRVRLYRVVPPLLPECRVHVRRRIPTARRRCPHLVATRYISAVVSCSRRCPNGACHFFGCHDRTIRHAGDDAA